MTNTNQLDLLTFKELMTEQDKKTQPVYSWLCNSDYNHYLMKIFNDNLKDE